MYVIIVYDVSVKRVAKICQFLRQYLNWVQNSVFEGEVTVSELFRIKKGIKEIINVNEDSVVIYSFHSEKVFKKEHIGLKKTEESFVI